ncbi:MAG TPA: creatininase family protein [Candidatus Bathyarchaeia archaeon]|nr:creatininase family protein [Candidatus Bathyarchaeia archaeon]
MTSNLSTLSWTQFDERLKTTKNPKILLPIGSLEQHGPHLPLATDTIIANHISQAVSQKSESCFLMPSLVLGCSLEHMGFPGTISLQVETLTNTILDIAVSLRNSGLTKVFIINGHGGNRATIDSTLIKLKHAYPDMDVFSFTIIDLVKKKYGEIRKSTKRLVGHADEIETSMMMAIMPELVDMRKAVSEVPALSKAVSFEEDDLAKVSFGWRATDLTKSGILGDPRTANPGKGKILIDYAVETIASIVNSL